MIKTDLTYKDILSRLGYFMNKEHISAYELSLRLGHNSNYIYKIQSCKIKLTVKKLVEILEILEITAFEFFYPDLENYESDMKKFNFVNNLSEEEFNSIMAILKIKNK
ncbi:MAG: hypothetical protein IJ415_00320 [Clostridia bacterium]|nr:hypothetical protein [Clostridia bacterium]